MSARRTSTPRGGLLVAATLVCLALVLTACGPKALRKDGTGGAAGDGSPSATQPPDPRFEIPAVGQCHRMTVAESQAPVATAAQVKCSGPHNTVVAHVALVPGALTAQTPLARRRTVAAATCEPAFRNLVGGTPALRATSILTWAFFTPSKEQLDRGARWVRCDVLARSGDALVRLPATTPILRGGLPQALRVCQTQKGADVSCAQPHAFRVAAVFQPKGAGYPDPDKFTVTARARCAGLTGIFGGYWQPPSQAGWAAGDHFVRCLTRKG